MGDKVKPWRQQRVKKNKKIVPLRSGDERVIPMRIDGGCPTEPPNEKSYWDRERW